MKVPNSVLVEPYRLFFPLGWIAGIVGASYWLLISTDLVSGYAPLYHGLIQIELFCSAFAVGFLLTALPKFLRTRSASVVELAVFLVVYLVLAGAILSNALIIGQWSFIAFLLLLIRFALVRVNERKSTPPFSFYLIGFGLLEGLFGALLIIFPLSAFPLLGEKLLEQGMFLSLSLGVGSFLGPRLMRVVDTENAIVSLAGRGSDNLSWYRSPSSVVFAIGILIFASFIVETGWNREVGLYIRGVVSLFCLARFNVLKIPRSPQVIGVLVAMALWTMPLGFFLAALFPSHEVAALHVTYIGGFGLLILTIGAQVVSSHGVVHNFWQNHRAGALSIAVLIFLSVLFRLSVTLFPSHYFFLIGVAAFAFNIAMLCWGFGVLRHIGSGAQFKENPSAFPSTPPVTLPRIPPSESRATIKFE